MGDIVGRWPSSASMPVLASSHAFVPAGGRCIRPDEAHAYVFAHGAGVDLTRRDLQTVAKSKGQPWDCSKGFDFSAPIGALTPADGNSALAEQNRSMDLQIALRVRGNVRQKSTLGQMTWGVAELIHHLSQVRPVCRYSQACFVLVLTEFEHSGCMLQACTRRAAVL